MMLDTTDLDWLMENDGGYSKVINGCMCSVSKYGNWFVYIRGVGVFGGKEDAVWKAKKVAAKVARDYSG